MTNDILEINNGETKVPRRGETMRARCDALEIKTTRTRTSRILLGFLILETLISACRVNQSDSDRSDRLTRRDAAAMSNARNFPRRQL